MKLIIAHGQTKRKIEGPWDLCGSREDLESVVQQIRVALDTGMYYGWVKIVSREQPILSNTPPVPWE